MLKYSTEQTQNGQVKDSKFILFRVKCNADKQKLYLPTIYWQQNKNKAKVIKNQKYHNFNLQISKQNLLVTLSAHSQPLG